MKIKEKTYVALEYQLSLDSGEVVDRTPEGQQFAFVTGMGQILPGLENQIMGMETGTQTKVSLEPAEGYGESREDLIMNIPRDRFPQGVDINPGTRFRTDTPDGPAMLTVKSVADESVEVDFNHPLADERLHFDVTITDVRQPTGEELAAAEQGMMCDPQGETGCGGGCNCC